MISHAGQTTLACVLGGEKLGRYPVSKRGFFFFAGKAQIFIFKLFKIE